MTLEERKRKFREKYGYSDEDYDVFTPAEYDAYKKAQQTTSVGAFYEGAKEEVVPGLGAGLAAAGALRAMSKIPIGRGGVWGTVAKGVGVLGTALIGDVATRKGQEAVLEAVRTEDEVEADLLLSQQLRDIHPKAYTQ